ncbi:MAG: tetratricopeptide repeat protein [Cyclobacteriaceae bacterium]
MNQERIKRLNEFLQDDPKDPFSKYALAIEYLNNNKQKSKELFDDLLLNHSEYIATYYHAAALYSELNQREKAEEIYEQGIALAEELNESHALRELKSAYLNFQFEE